MSAYTRFTGPAPAARAAPPPFPSLHFPPLPVRTLQVIAVAERGALFDPGPCMYMEKLAVGPQVSGEEMEGGEGGEVRGRGGVGRGGVGAGAERGGRGGVDA